MNPDLFWGVTVGYSMGLLMGFCLGYAIRRTGKARLKVVVKRER